MGGDCGGSAWGRFSVVVLASVLVLGVTTGTIADYHQDKCSEEGGEQYGESDCSGVYCSPPGCEDDDPEYEDNENYICSETELATQGDLDGDGTLDCDDPDDDGDSLSDKLEREYTPSGYRDKDSDSWDSPHDGYDIVPDEAWGAFATITAATYTTPSAEDDCGDGVDLSDPFIPDGELEVSYGKDDLNLVPPEGWADDPDNDEPSDGDDPDGRFENGHWHERPADQVGDLVLDDGDDGSGNGDVTENEFNLPDDIRDFPGDEPNGIPRVTLQIGLMDHDEIWHDRMDISTGGGTIAEFDPYPLTIDDSTGTYRDESGDGGGDCDAGLGFDFTDTANKHAVRAAVYHRDNPDDPVVQSYDLNELT